MEMNRFKHQKNHNIDSVMLNCGWMGYFIFHLNKFNLPHKTPLAQHLSRTKTFQDGSSPFTGNKQICCRATEIKNLHPVFIRVKVSQLC